MSVLEWRGGIPAVHKGTVAATVTKIIIADHLRKLPAGKEQGRFSRGVTKWLCLRNPGAVAFRVYYFEQHSVDNESYITVKANECINGPIEVHELWVRSDTAAAASYEITAVLRRG